METVNDTAMHVTEKKTLSSSLTPVSMSDEISKEREEELLYGNNEDGDEEDTASDDSIRLRVSDDEADLDEPSSSKNLNNGNNEPESTNMELGSDVPANDTSQRNISMREEKLINGKCAINEKSKSLVNQDNKTAKDGLTSGTQQITDKVHTESATAESFNGTSEQSDKREPSDGSSMRNQANRNSLKDSFCRGSRTSPLPQAQTLRQFFSTQNEKYYNKNTHYGGGKGSNRGSRQQHNESTKNESHSEEKYSSRSFSTSNSGKKPETARKIEASSSKIKAEKSMIKQETVRSVDSKSEVPNDMDSSHVMKSEMKRSSELRGSDEVQKKENLKIDNTEAASSVDFIAERLENNESTAAPSREDSTADASMNQELDAVKVKSEVDDCNASAMSDETLIADNATDIAQDLNDDEEKSTAETPSKSTSCESEEPKMDSYESEITRSPPKVDQDPANNAESVATEKQDEGTTDAKSSAADETTNPNVNAATKETVAFGASGDLPSKASEDVESAIRMETNADHCNDELATIEKTASEPSEPQAIIVASGDAKQIPDEEPPADSLCQLEITGKQLTADAKSGQPLEESRNVVMDPVETIEEADISVDMTNTQKAKISEIEASIADLPDEKETSSDDDGEGTRVTINSTLKREPPKTLDEMELSKRMRIQRPKSTDLDESRKAVENKSELVSTQEHNTADARTSKDNGSVSNPVINSVGDTKLNSESGTSAVTNTVVETSSNDPKAAQEKVAFSASVHDDVSVETMDDCEVIEVPVKRRQKRTRRSLQESLGHGNIQEKENVRQKRRTAKNAEEMIRKDLQGNSDSDSSDSAGKLVPFNYKRSSNDLRATSPPTLKRNLIDDDDKTELKLVKKLKQDVEMNGEVPKIDPTKPVGKVQILRHVKQFFQRDKNGKLPELTQQEIEELLIQKMVETITMRVEIGKLREEAKAFERNQEASRLRCQQLTKQIKDFEMVLNRYNSDRRANPEKTVVPIKINRSVGLQVNFVTDHGIQNLRQLGQVQKTAPPTMNGINSPQKNEQSPNANPGLKRTVKIRYPRRPEQVTPVSAAAQTAIPSPIHNQPVVSNITPAALVVANKSVQDTRPSAASTVQQTNVQQHLKPTQTILVNGLTSAPVRQTPIPISKPTHTNNLIDLTQEEDKTKTTVIPQNAILTTSLTEAPSNVTNIPQRYHTVIQTIPAGVSLSAPGIRLVQPSGQPTPTALVNNMNAPRLAYVMQGPMGGPRKVVITSGPAQIRPAPDHQTRTIRTTFPISGTITNSTVRVIPSNTTATLQVCKHPAALPESINPPSNAAWKLPPPAPSLKISKVANGIVLSWNMALSDKFADIASYQLYAYQEVAGIAPSSTMWKKVGDVRALPLPMACTLTQFSEGNNYYFAVRAVDRHSRLGQYSQPGNISL